MAHEKLIPNFSFNDERLLELKGVAPEAFIDGRLDWDTLREALGNYLEDGEGAGESFGLSWPGKREARRLAAKPSHGALLPAPSEGVDEANTRNLFLEGDNLEVLKLLQKSYAGRVKMIYIDPPYNTGNDFIYKDDFSEPLDVYLERSGQIGEGGEMLTSNPKSSGRFHSNWLNMIYPRLRLARTLLRDDGVIFISIDDNEVHNLRAVMNEIFGEENFVATISVVNNLKGRNDKKHIATANEYLLMVAQESFDSFGLPLSEKQLAEYGQSSDDGEAFQWRDLRKRGGADTRISRPNLYYPIYVNPQNGDVSLEEKDNWKEVFPSKKDGTEGCWRWGKSKVSENLSTVRGIESSIKGKWNISYQVSLFRNGKIRSAKPKSVWMDTQYSTDAATKSIRELMPNFDAFTPKPTAFIKSLLQLSTEEDDIVLDFFAGSATTAHAVIQLNNEDGSNRQFICVQVPEETGRDDYATIAEISKERIRRAIKKIGAQPALPTRETPEDLGFKVFKLAPSNLKVWRENQDVTPEQLSLLFDGQETPLCEGWTPDDLRAEVLLLEGFPLDSRVEAQPLFSKNALFLVTSPACAHRLWTCFDPKLDARTLDNLALQSDDVFVCLDSALDDNAKLRLAALCTLKTI